MVLPPPRSTLTATLFPFTPLFRSARDNLSIGIEDVPPQPRLGRLGAVVRESRAHHDLGPRRVERGDMAVDAGAAMIHQVDMDGIDGDLRHRAIEAAEDLEIARRRHEVLGPASRIPLAVVGRAGPPLRGARPHLAGHIPPEIGAAAWGGGV